MALAGRWWELVCRERVTGTYPAMSFELGAADLEASVPLDPYAPSYARFCVGQVDSPSPDLRDATALLTSELVTRAVQLYPRGDRLRLRIWMPPDVVRVEIAVGRDFFLPPPGASGEHYGRMLLDELADRWSVEPVRERAAVWFEIDRHPVGREDSESHLVSSGQ